MKAAALASFGMFVSAALTLGVVAQTKNAPGAAPAAVTPGPDETKSAAADQEKEQAAVPKTEEEFVQKAAKSGMIEVKIAKLAVEKAEGEKVKELARTLVTDHTAANEALQKAAKELKIPIDETPDAKHEEKFAELQKQQGTAFDTAFIMHMDRSHAKGIAWYEGGRTMAKSDHVKAFIEKTLPVLRKHHEMVKALLPAVQSKP